MATPDFEDDFTTDKGWTTTDASEMDYNATNDNLDVNSVLTSTNDCIVKDLQDTDALGSGVNLDDEAYVLRYKITIVALNDGSTGTAKILYMGVSSADESAGQTTAQDFQGMGLQLSNVKNEMGLYDRDGADLTGGDESEFTTAMSVTTWWIEQIRTADNAYTVEIFDADTYDAADSVEKETGVCAATIVNLRYIKFCNRSNSTANGNIQVTIDDVEVYNGVTSVSTTETQTFTMDLVVEETQTQTFTMDLVVEETQTVTFTLDVVIQEVQTVTFTMDLVVQEVQTQTFTLDLVVQETQTTTFTLDLVISETQTATFTMDLVIQEQQTQTFTMDLVIEEVQTNTFTLDLVIQEVQTQTFTLDLVIQETQTSTFTLDLYIEDGVGIETQTFTLDVVIQESQTQTFTLDLVVQETQTTTFTLDLVVQEIQTSTFTLDLVVQEVQTSTFTMDLFIDTLTTLGIGYPELLPMASVASLLKRKGDNIELTHDTS